MMCSPWGCKELDMTEQLSLTHSMPVKPYFCLFSGLYTPYPIPLCMYMSNIFGQHNNLITMGEMQMWLQNLAL